MVAAVVPRAEAPAAAGSAEVWRDEAPGPVAVIGPPGFPEEAVFLGGGVGIAEDRVLPLLLLPPSGPAESNRPMSLRSLASGRVPNKLGNF